MGEISFSPSQTPLNVTITPARFFARHSSLYSSEREDFIYPLVVKITAPSNLDSGRYLVSFTQQGGGKDPEIIYKDKGTAFQQIIFVEVTVE